MLGRLMALSLAYLLDQIHISRGDADIVDRLLIAAVIDANIGPIKQDPALQRAYGALDAAAPDEVLRPVSVNALAQSLTLPFETVRRRIGRLVERGACLMTAEGVFVPQAALASPQFKAMSLARYERLRRFYLDLKAAEALPDIAPGRGPAADGGAWFASDEAPVRVVNRILAEHLLRFIEGVTRRAHDPLMGLFAMELARANTGHLPLPPAGTGRRFAEGRLRPVPLATLAARLSVPHETLRRRALLAQAHGFCRRTDEGLLIQHTAFDHPEVVGLMRENAANLQRLFTRLDRIGCLAAWDG